MQIYYFTRTGNCERIAQEIAKSKNLVAFKIDDGKDWSGKVNFVKAGAMSAKRESLEVTHEKIEQTGDVVVVFPIWAGTFPPAIRGFLKNVDNKRVTAVAVSAVSSLGNDEQNMFGKFFETKGKVTSAPQELL